ncbi:MAG: hypothetical protein IAE85_06955 [Anaerolinea sp.]|nr:hypothetical protein [Anaerolinea sp.]
MQDFATWFCLNNRQNFTIDPQVNPDDAQYYFGRDDIKERLLRQIRRSFIAPGVPKMMVWGPYGSGKTQTLFYLEYSLKNQTPASAKGAPHTLYLTVEMRSNSNASHLHMQMMEALGKSTVAAWVRDLFNSTSEFDKALLDLAGNDPNIFLALRELRATGESSFVAWRWLTGQALKGGELSGLSLTRSLGEVGAGDMVNALVAIGNLAGRVNQKVIFLLDELEELQNVKAGDAAESIHQYLRRLSEPANASVGFLIGFKADVLDDAPAILRRGDIVGRVGPSNYIDIPPLPAVADVKTFVKELLKNLTDSAKVETWVAQNGLSVGAGEFPFEHSAFELLADYATQDITRALPRYIINAINECAIQAWDEEKLLIDDAIVNNVAPFAFS